MEMFFHFTCINCQESSQGVRIHCVVCKEDLCLQCFASGAEIGPHKNNHAYQIMDSGGLSIFRGKGSWSAREELRLLDAVEHYGFGNWEDISKLIETRSPEDAKEEYIQKFLKGTIGRHTWQMDAEHKPNLIDHTLEWEDQNVIKELENEHKPYHDITHEDAVQLDYMPNRDDFEREYDPEAEKLVSNLSLEPNDDEVETQLKLAHVDVYRRRLRERARRKRLVRDYQLISDFFRGNMKRLSQTTDERQFRESLRTFAQFYTHFDYEQLLNSLERERILRIQLSELYRYRWNGLTKFDECAHFELHAAANQNQSTGPWGHGKTQGRPNEPTSSNVQLDTIMKNQLLAIKKEKDEKENSNSIDQKSMHPTGGHVSLEGSWPSKNSWDNIQSQGSSSNLLQLQQMDPVYQLGANLLTFNEKQLCSSLNLPPSRFITVKTVLLSGAQTNNGSSEEKQIKKYLVKSGWLSSTSSSSGKSSQNSNL